MAVLGPPSGVDLQAFDRGAEPCVDFSQYACGGWIRDHELPTDAARYSRGSEPFWAAVPDLRALVEQPDVGTDDGQLIFNYRAACLNAPTDSSARDKVVT